MVVCWLAGWGEEEVPGASIPNGLAKHVPGICLVGCKEPHVVVCRTVGPDRGSLIGARDGVARE